MFKQRLIIVEKTKNDKVREIPFHNSAAYWLNRLVRYLSISQVFVNTRTGRPWVNPDKAFTRGCEKAGVNAGFHDLRRMRCTLWFSLGVDARTIQKLMGHADITTTMRYAGYLPEYAIRSVRDAQALEE